MSEALKIRPCPACGGMDITSFHGGPWRCGLCGNPYVVVEPPAPAAPRQVGGDHYAKHAIQPWDVIACWFGRLTGLEAFLAGSVVKRLARYRDKGGVEDLKKARHELDRLIEHMEGGE